MNYDAQKLLHLNWLVDADELDYKLIIEDIESLVLNGRQHLSMAAGL